jgi:hypothetical protein
MFIIVHQSIPLSLILDRQVVIYYMRGWFLSGDRNVGERSDRRFLLLVSHKGWTLRSTCSFLPLPSLATFFHFKRLLYKGIVTIWHRDATLGYHSASNICSLRRLNQEQCFHWCCLRLLWSNPASIDSRSISTFI